MVDDSTTYGTTPSDCDHVVTTEAPRPELPTRGRFVKGQPGPRLRTGEYSRLVRQGLLPEQAAIRQHLREQEQAIVADLGGPSTLATVKRHVVARYIELAFVAEHLRDNLLNHGVLTGKGRTRAALTAWLSVLDRLERHAKLIGLERAERDVESLEAYLERTTHDEPDAVPHDRPETDDVGRRDMTGPADDR